VTSETTLGPSPEQRLLEQLEAEFLRPPPDFWPEASETEVPEPGSGWAVDDGPQMWMTQWRTRRGCCG
jgi:hypothetical protein